MTRVNCHLYVTLMLFLMGGFMSCRKDKNLPDEPETPYVWPKPTVDSSNKLVVGNYGGTKTWISDLVIHYTDDVPFKLDDGEYSGNGFYAQFASSGYGNGIFDTMVYLYRWSGYCDFGKEDNFYDTTWTFSTTHTDSSDPVIKKTISYSLCTYTDTVACTPHLYKKQRDCDSGEVLMETDDWTNSTIWLYYAHPIDMYPDHSEYTSDTTFHYGYYHDRTCWNIPFGQAKYYPFKTNDGRLGWVKLTLTDLSELVIHEVVAQF